ncbi:MAG: LytTR family DNA-binding domain-containing protein [Burkholderiaceae bacterium]
MTTASTKSATIRAVIADDEPLLIESLARELSRVWPSLEIAGRAQNGPQALAAVMEHEPDIVFLDIQMPGSSGIQVAEAIAEDWTDNIPNQPPPLIVFVTAHDEYAIDAFRAAAVDYLLKPVNPQRLTTTVQRLKQRQQLRQTNPDTGIDGLSAQIRHLLSAAQAQHPSSGAPGALKFVRASAGDTVHMIPVDEVVLFESADKYVLVHTPEREALIREPLRNLLVQLDPQQFAQIHRGAIVNLSRVQAAVRDETGKLKLHLKGVDLQPVVSRIHRHLFSAM